MASRLWMCSCLLSIIIFTFVAAEEINDNITCTFTSGKDCSHLLNLNNTTEYIIEKEYINRTGVKIIFDTEQGVKSLLIKSGEALENRVRVLNITRGSLNHLVNLSCSEEIQVDEITLEPVIVSREIQIDFVKGCRNDSDPIIIKSLYYTVATDEEGLLEDTFSTIPLTEETQTDGAYIPTGVSGIDLLTSTTDQQEQSGEVEGSTVKTTSHILTEGMKTIPTSSTKRYFVITGKPMTKEKKNPDFEIAASISSAKKVSQDFACLFLALFIFKNA